MRSSRAGRLLFAAGMVGVTVAMVGSALAKRPPTPPPPPPVEVILDRLALGLSPEAAVAALGELARLAAPVSVDALARYARHLDPAVRIAALGALAALADPRAQAALVAALGDVDAGVRTAAAAGVAQRGERGAVPRLIALVAHGDRAIAPSLATLADADTALKVAELVGHAPDGAVAVALGAMLLRPTLGADTVYLGVVRALGGIPGRDAVEALGAYVRAAPAGPSRPSVTTARSLYEQRSQP